MVVTERQKDRKTERQKDRKTDRQADRQTDRQSRGAPLLKKAHEKKWLESYS